MIRSVLEQSRQERFTERNCFFISEYLNAKFREWTVEAAFIYARYRRVRVPSPRAFPVSMVCCNEHSKGFCFAMRRPQSGGRMGSGVTIRDCIADARRISPSGARNCCHPEERPEIYNSCLRRSRILPTRNPLCESDGVTATREADGSPEI